jgi:hypothetical protein
MPKKNEKTKEGEIKSGASGVTEVRFLPTLGQVPSFYANNANIKSTFWDVVVDFGQIRGTEGKALLVEPTATVVMSWPHAKAFLGIMQNIVKNYETQFGEIVMPPNSSVKQPKPVTIGKPN